MSEKDEAKEYDNIIQQLCDEMTQNRLTDRFMAKASGVAEACYVSTSSTPTYGAYTETYLLHEIRKDIDHVIRVLSAKRLSPSKAKDVLEEVIENITCDHECKSCKYYRPKAVDYCNTARRIADYIVDTGIVEVYKPETK